MVHCCRKVAYGKGLKGLKHDKTEQLKQTATFSNNISIGTNPAFKAYPFPRHQKVLSGFFAKMDCFANLEQYKCFKYDVHMGLRFQI